MGCFAYRDVCLYGAASSAHLSCRTFAKKLSGANGQFNISNVVFFVLQFFLYSLYTIPKSTWIRNPHSSALRDSRAKRNARRLWGRDDLHAKPIRTVAVGLLAQNDANRFALPWWFYERIRRIPRLKTDVKIERIAEKNVAPVIKLSAPQFATYFYHSLITKRKETGMELMESINFIIFRVSTSSVQSVGSLN